MPYNTLKILYENFEIHPLIVQYLKNVIEKGRLAREISVPTLTSTTGTGRAELPHCDNQQPTSAFQVAFR
jgi:hypothetical protein